MWIRTIKVTFANELMKKAVRSYFSEKIDASLGQLVTYSVDLSENVVLVTHIFPDKSKSVCSQRNSLCGVLIKYRPFNPDPVLNKL